MSVEEFPADGSARQLEGGVLANSQGPSRGARSTPCHGGATQRQIWRRSWSARARRLNCLLATAFRIAPGPPSTSAPLRPAETALLRVATENPHLPILLLHDASGGRRPARVTISPVCSTCDPAHRIFDLGLNAKKIDDKRALAFEMGGAREMRARLPRRDPGTIRGVRPLGAARPGTPKALVGCQRGKCGARILALSPDALIQEVKVCAQKAGDQDGGLPEACRRPSSRSVFSPGLNDMTTSP